LVANLPRVVAVLDVEIGLEQVDHRQIRRRLAVRDRAALPDEPATIAMRLHDLPNQSGLADARLPNDRHDLAVAGGGSGQRLADLRQLEVPTPKGRQGAPSHVE